MELRLAEGWAARELGREDDRVFRRSDRVDDFFWGRLRLPCGCDARVRERHIDSEGLCHVATSFHFVRELVGTRRDAVLSVRIE